MNIQPINTLDCGDIVGPWEDPESHFEVLAIDSGKCWLRDVTTGVEMISNAADYGRIGTIN